MEEHPKKIQDPERRQVIKRLSETVLIAAAATTGTLVFFDQKHPVPSRKTIVKRVPDHRVDIPKNTL